MFSVRWRRTARNMLADIWVNATNRNAVTAATSQIDHQLARDPDNVGESRPKGRRVLLVPPLGVIYRVNTQTRVVTVIRVWYIATP